MILYWSTFKDFSMPLQNVFQQRQEPSAVNRAWRPVWHKREPTQSSSRTSADFQAWDIFYKFSYFPGFSRTVGNLLTQFGMYRQEERTPHPKVDTFSPAAGRPHPKVSVSPPTQRGEYPLPCSRRAPPKGVCSLSQAHSTQRSEYLLACSRHTRPKGVSSLSQAYPTQRGEYPLLCS